MGTWSKGDKRTAAESMSRVLLSPSLSADGSQLGSQAASGERAKTEKGPLTWARSEGLEPPAF
jgi:hypothetical protein